MAERKPPDPGLLNEAWDTTKSGAYKLFETINYPNELMLKQTVTPEQWKSLKAQNNGGIIDARDIMQMKGVMGKKDTWGNFFVGLGLDMAADWMNFAPIASRSGSAARLTGKSIDPKTVTSALTEGAFKGTPSSAAAPKPLIGQPLGNRVRSDLMKRGVDPAYASTADVTGKSGKYSGLARRYGNIQQLLDAADAGVNIPGLNALRADLKKITDPAKLNKILKQPLQADIGINIPGIPFLKQPNQIAAFGAAQGGEGLVNKGLNLGAQAVGDTLTQGRLAVPSKIAAKTARIFDNKVGATLDEGDQAVTKVIAEAGDAGGALGRRSGARATRMLRSADEAGEVLSETGNKALADKMEKPLDIFDSAAGQVRPRTAGELASGFGNNFGLPDAVTRNMDQYVKWWDEIAQTGLQADKKFGVSSYSLDDKRLGGYLSRQLNPMQSKEVNSAVQDIAGSQNPANRTIDSSMLERSIGTKIPGGRNVLSFELASDPFLVGPKRLAKTDEEAAKKILDTVFPNVQDKLAKRKADELSNILKRMPDIVDNNGKVLKDKPSPMYGQHPTESVMSYLENRGRARGVAEAQIDHMAARAIKGKDAADANPFNSSKKSVTMSNALETINLNKSAKQELRNRIAKYKNIDPNQVKLGDYFVPQDAMRSLQVPSQTYNRPTDLTTLEGIINWAQSVWRNSILLWPARYVRDKVGGIIVNMYEGWFDVADEAAAARIVAYGAYDTAAQSHLSKIPRYADLSPNAASDMFYEDLMEANITGFGQRLDHGVAGEMVQDKFIGVSQDGKGTIRQVTDGYVEAMKDIGSMFNREGQFAEAGAKVGDVVDTSNRLSAFINLLRKGNTPEVAATNIKRAHVDYSSLTDVEARFRDSAMPFYTYFSRMLLEQGRRTLQDGARAQRFLRGYTAGERNDYQHRRAAPEYLRDRGAMTSPFSPQDQYLYGLDVPGFEQASYLYNLANVPLALTNPDSAASAQAAYDQTVSSLSPSMKMIGQFATGRVSDGIQQGIPFGQKEGTLFRALKDGMQATGVQAQPRNTLGMRLLDEAVSVSPLVRATGLGRQLMSNMKDPTVGGFANTAASNLSGFRAVDVDEQARVRARLEGINRSVSAGAQGYERTFENSYIPQDALSALQANDPKTARRYEVQKSLRSQQKKMYEAKESGRVPTGMRNRN